jgi:adenylate kinase
MMKNQRLTIIMLGPPGAGKGTQARQMSEALLVPHISTGDMLREALRHESELGKKAKAFMNSGALVPDELVDAIVAERVSRTDCGRGVILDGYPRTIPQAEFLKSVLEKDEARILTLGIKVRDEELIKRLSSRWTCPNCGKMFNALLDAGKAGGNCDACDSPLSQRKDDTPEVIAERLQVYELKTAPLIRYYKDRGLYVEVNGERAVDDIFDFIMTVVRRN